MSRGWAAFPDIPPMMRVSLPSLTAHSNLRTVLSQVNPKPIPEISTVWSHSTTWDWGGHRNAEEMNTCHMAAPQTQKTMLMSPQVPLQVECNQIPQPVPL